MREAIALDGMVPDALAVRSSKIMLDSLEVMADIGFHDYEIGTPQRLLVTIELWFDPSAAPVSDEPGETFDYDFLRCEVRRLAAERRYNLQETLARRIYDRLAALAGVKALKVATAKPDIYDDARAVGVEIASFNGHAPG
jgi:dihydroneopterin aldolase